MPNDPKSAIKGSRHPSAVSSGTSSFPRENGYPKLCLLDRDSVKNWNRPHERPSSSRAFSLIPLLDCHEAGRTPSLRPFFLIRGAHRRHSWASSAWRLLS